MTPFHRSWRARRAAVAALALGAAQAAGAAVSLPPASTQEGYVCRLLINEVPFPGERGYRSEQDTMVAMNSLLNVLDARLLHVPTPYTQSQVAATRADDVIDIITAGGVRGQFDGFYRDEKGQPVMVKRVTDRIDRLLAIANQGQPGRFANIMTHASAIATAYVREKQTQPNVHAAIQSVGGVSATGRAYSWMTDSVQFHPGGSFLRIPDEQSGSLGGNRFFTLRKEPK